nr:hypothetical protein HmN_000437700 [Hymenolepis microstoma]
MDTIDVVFASCSIVRPGIRKSLRIRRKNTSRNAIDLCKVKWRPNPRTKSFSDASISDVKIETHFINLIRSDRNVSLVAEKLVMTKSCAVDERRKSSIIRSRRMRVLKISEDYEDNLSNEVTPVPETQEQPRERNGDPEHTAEELRRRIVNPQLSFDDYKLLNQRITGIIFNLKTLSINKDEESGEENCKVVPSYLDNAQSIVNDEFALSENESQHMLEECQYQFFSRCKSVREGENALFVKHTPCKSLNLGIFVHR